MQKIEVFDVFFNGFSSTWKHELIQGVLFILFGLTIVFFPQLLVAMIAAFFMLIGVILISSAWALRSFRRRYDSSRSEIFNLFR